MSELAIPQSEYEERWRKAQQACGERGFAGLLVWSRGGAMTDAYADVFYLSNHYTQFPLVADAPPRWVGKAHSAIVLPLDGQPTLLVDIPDWRRDLVAVEDTRFSLDLPAAVAAVLRERRLEGERLGLVGGNAMQVSPYLHLTNAVPSAELVPADDLVERIRALKSPRELEFLRASAEAGHAIVGAMMEAASQSGRTEAEAVAAAYAEAATRGVAMYDAATASGPNSDYYAFGRLPSWTTRTLEPGDFFHVDCYGALDGYLFDFSRTCVVGRRASEDQLAVLDGLVEAVDGAIDTIRPGVRAGDLYTQVRGALVQRGLASEEPAGSGAALLSSFPGHGHSLGLSWEAPWLSPGEDGQIEANMCIAIEVMGGHPGVGSAKFEQDVIVHQDRVELLTTLPKYYG